MATGLFTCGKDTGTTQKITAIDHAMDISIEY